MMKNIRMAGLSTLLIISIGMLCMKCSDGPKDKVKVNEPSQDSLSLFMTDSSRLEWKEVDSVLGEGIMAQSTDYAKFASILDPSMFGSQSMEDFINAKHQQEATGIISSVNNYKLTKLSPIVEDSAHYYVVTWHSAERITHFEESYGGNPIVFLNMMKEQFAADEIRYDEINRDIIADGEMKLYAKRPKSGGEWKFILDGYWQIPEAKGVIPYDQFIELRMYE